MNYGDSNFGSNPPLIHPGSLTNMKETGTATQYSQTIEFGQLFQNTLFSCEKTLSTILNAADLQVTTRRNLMLSLFKVKARMGRFLALYRWKNRSKVLSNTKNEIPSEIACNKSIVALKNISNYMLKTKIGNLNAEQIRSEEIKIDTNERKTPRDIFLTLFLGNVPNSITNVFFSKNKMTLTYFDTVSVTFKAKQNGSLSLTKLNYDTPFENTECSTKTLIKLIKGSTRNQKTLLENLHTLFHKFITNTKIFHLLENIATCNTPYKVKLKATHNEISITLPQSFAPYNVFYVTRSTTSTDIYVNSAKPLYDSETKTYKFRTFKNPVAEKLMADMFDAVNLTCVHALTESIERMLKEISIEVSVVVHCYTIYIELGKLDMITILRDSSTGEQHIKLCYGICTGNKEVYNSIINNESSTRRMIKILADEIALSILFHNSGSLSSWSNWSQSLYSPYIPCITFSSCEEFCFTLCGNRLNPKIQLLIDKEDYKNHYSSIEQLPPISAAILLQLKHSQEGKNKVLSKNGIAFSPDAISIAKLSMNERNEWRISVSGSGISSIEYVITGSTITARFVEYAFNVAKTVAHFIDIQRQIQGINDVDVDSSTPGEFSVSYMHESVPRIYISLSGLIYNEKTKYHISFCADKKSAICSNVSFTRYSKIKAHVQKMLHSEKHVNKFSSFMASAIAQLCIIQDVFLNENKNQWALSQLSDESSFSLVFQKKFTMNIMWKSTNIFQIIIPIVSPSVVLQIALRKFPGFNPAKRTSHPTLRIHTSQLSDLKMYIEEFFNDRDAIITAKFHPAKNDEDKMPIFEQNKLSKWLQMNASMTNNGLEVKLTTENQNAIRLLNAFAPFNASRELMRIKLIFLSAISEKPEIIGSAIARAIEEIARLPGVDWILLVKKTMFLPSPSLGVKFNSIKYQHGEFKLEITIVSGQFAISVEGDLPLAQTVSNFQSFNFWITSLLRSNS